MFSSVTTRLFKDLEDLKGIIRWQDDLRATVHMPIGGSPQIPIDQPSLDAVRSHAPQKLAWQLFDHCAAVTRIYALFEQAVCDLVSEYLAFLPKTAPAYRDLNEDIRIQYRIGVAHILSKWKSSKSLYSHLAEDAIAAGLADGLRQMPYALLSDAFLIDSDNFRTDTINRLFKRFGFEDAFSWVRAAPRIQEFCTKNLGTESADSYLNEFVRARNEAAHGNIATVSSVKEILTYAEFSALVIEELASLLRSHMVRTGVSVGCAEIVGEVKHAWSDNVVGVSSLLTTSIKTGDVLFAGKKRLYPVTIVNLRILAVDHAEISTVPGLEFGLKFDISVSPGSQLYRWIGS
jgi:hypothetical protein